MESEENVSENIICKSLTFSHKLCHISAISVSPDHIYAMPTDGGLHITKLLNSPVHKDQELSFMTVIIPPGEILHFDVGVKRRQLHTNFNYDHLDEMYKVMIDRTQSPGIKSGVSFKEFKLAKWSPLGADHNRRSVIATLTLDHRLAVYEVHTSKTNYQLIKDMSVEFYNCLQEEDFAIVANRIEVCPDPKSQFTILEQRTYALAAVDMVWSDLWSSATSQYSLMFVVMKSGHLVLWKIDFPVTEKSFVLLEMIDMGNAVPSCTNVIRINRNMCILFVGYQNGQIKSFTVHRQMDEFEVLENTPLWTDVDDIMVSHIRWLEKDNILLCVKGTFLLAFQLGFTNGEDRFKILQENHKVVSSKLPVTELCCKKGMVFLSIQDGTILKCNITFTPEINIETTPFPIVRPTLQSWGSFGLQLTENLVYLLEVSSPISHYDHLQLREPLRVNLIQVKSFDRVAKDLNLAAEAGAMLFEIKDLLVCIKCAILKQGSFPKDLVKWLTKKDTWSEKTITWLKILRYLLQVKLSNTVQAVGDDVKEGLENDLETVNKLILLKHTSECLQILLDAREAEGLSKTDITCIYLMCKFLQNSDLSNNIQRSLAMTVCKILNLSTDGQLPLVLESCNMCNADISTNQVYKEGCPNGHNISRCSQTLMICQVLPYRVCENCHMLAVALHVKGSEWFESLKTNYCTFCDGIVK